MALVWHSSGTRVAIYSNHLHAAQDVLIDLRCKGHARDDRSELRVEEATRRAEHLRESVGVVRVSSWEMRA